MNILITLCARGGSKGIPGKNIKPIAGKPLIAYTIECAKKLGGNYNTIVALSTDDEEIASTAAAYGLQTDYRRPAELATDSAGKMDVIKALMQYEETRTGIAFDYVIDLDITSPLRTVEDITEALKIIEADKEAYNLFSVNPAARNPYFNMVEQKENGYYKTIISSKFITRQAAPKVYDMNASFYIYRRSFFESGNTSAMTDKSLIYVMPHICFDLDEVHDFEFMAFLLETGKLSFMQA